MSTPVLDKATLARVAENSLTMARKSLEETSTWLAVSDSEGRVVYEWSSNKRMRGLLESSSVALGSQLGLEAAGINGIGVALARQSFAVVRGGEHENNQWQSLACAASPLIDARNRKMIGAVNVTCLEAEANPFLKLMLKFVAEAVQATMKRAVQGRHARLLDHHLRVKASTRSVVITLDRHTMIIDDGAEHVSIDRSLIWTLLHEAGVGATELVFPTGECARIKAVDPVNFDSGMSLIFDRMDPQSIAQAVLMAKSARDATAMSNPLQQAEREVIAQLMRECGGNKSAVAHKLQLSRGTLYERIRRYGL